MLARRIRQLRFLSALKSEQVLDNLHTRERDWRESATPEELRKLGVTGLDIRFYDDTFALAYSACSR